MFISTLTISIILFIIGILFLLFGKLSVGWSDIIGFILIIVAFIIK